MYVTALDVQKRMAEDVLVYLVDDEREGSAIFAADGAIFAGSKALARVEQAITEGCAEADSYIGQKYSVPVTPVPDVLRAKALDVVVYRLFLRRGIRSGTADEAVLDQYKFAVAWLRDIATGKASIPATSSGVGAGTVSGNGGADITASERIFSRDLMKDF